MQGKLVQLAKEYVELLEIIERTSDPEKVQGLEEKRVQLHGKFMAMLRHQRIKFEDRDHATRIALKMAKEE